MKITIVQGAFLPVPPLMGGAVEKVWFGLGKEFARRGHEVTHISRQFGALAQNEVIEGVRHLRIKGYDTPASLARLKILDLFYSVRVLRTLPGADILVTNTFWLPVLTRRRKQGALYVHVARYPKGQMRLYRHAARLHTVSTPIAEAIIQEDPASKEKVRVIPYPLPFDLPEIKRETNKEQRDKYILYVGRVHEEKGIGLLIRAFQLLIEEGMKDTRLVIVGPWETKLGGGGETYYHALRDAGQNCDDWIDWIGPVFDSGELAGYYQRADLFVYPSLAEKGETFGLAPLEAMAYACPPLVSALKCFQDFIEDGKSGFIFDHRASNPAEALAKVMMRLIQSDTALRQAGEAALETAGRFTMQEIAEIYLRDFDSLVK